MYTVEELPDASTALTPGWTYVPDTGFDPAKAAITPSLGRKRRAGDTGGGGGGRGDLSSRQKNAIIRHLAELDRENHRDVPVPVRGASAGGREGRTKSTQNARRILASQKTFRNFLDDEEAFLAQQQQPHQSTSSTKIPKRTQKQPSSSSSRKHKHAASPKHEPSAAQSQSQSQSQNQGNQTLPKTPFDTHPLLRSHTPTIPSDRIMQALLSEPPLSYNAARAGPPSTGKAQRFFCAMCGHWGRIRCRNCQVRTCGLECFRLHEDSRCGAFF